MICFASLKGAPGVTATSLAVAASWSNASKAKDSPRRKVLIEADASGGALITRYHLAADPGLVSLAAAGRSGFDPDLIWRHSQELPGGLPVVAAPAIPAQSIAALDAIASDLGRHLSQRNDLDALVDMGRLYPGSPALSLAMQASALLVMSRPRPEDLQSAAAQLKALQPLPKHIGWVLVGDEPYGSSEVERAFGFPVVSVVADDRRSVDSFERGVEPRRLRRQPFFRTATSLAETLVKWLENASAANKNAQQVPENLPPHQDPSDASTTPEQRDLSDSDRVDR